MSEERKNSLIWGGMLLVGALGCASLRNNPALGISPLAVGIIEALIYVCILMCVRLSDWRMAAAIAVITPVYLWWMQFLDAFMIPIDILVNLTLMGCMMLALRTECKGAIAVLMLAVPAFAVLLLGEAVTMGVLKQEGVGRSLVVAWNTSLYSGLSILGSVLVCTPYKRKEARS